jgi:hypothetical protein
VSKSWQKVKSQERLQMRRQWEELAEFPNYQISDLGEIVNSRTDREIHPSINQQGIAKISLYKDRSRLMTRSLAVLVAETFIPQPNPQFNTPIHLDGDRMNCRVDNLVWRPRWFAIRYHRQFLWEAFHKHDVPLVELLSGALYHSVKEACIANGLYCQDVEKSIVEEVVVFPTWQIFQLAS